MTDRQNIGQDYPFNLSCRLHDAQQGSYDLWDL
jgi:hypothetical protein